jgi:hypothetical protein
MATTTAIRAGITDWADLGIPGAGSIMVVQPTNAETLFAVADAKPGVSPPIGFHLDPKVFTRITLNTPTVTHMWAYQPTKGGIMPTGGYVIVQSLAVPLAGRSQARSGGVASISSLKIPLAARSQTKSSGVL